LVDDGGPRPFGEAKAVPVVIYDAEIAEAGVIKQNASFFSVVTDRLHVHGGVAARAGPVGFEPDANAPVAVAVTTAVSANKNKCKVGLGKSRRRTRQDEILCADRYCKFDPCDRWS
jgi:hypothetical protein